MARNSSFNVRVNSLTADELRHELRQSAGWDVAFRRRFFQRVVAAAKTWADKLRRLGWCLELELLRAAPAMEILDWVFRRAIELGRRAPREITDSIREAGRQFLQVFEQILKNGRYSCYTTPQDADYILRSRLGFASDEQEEAVA